MSAGFRHIPPILLAILAGIAPPPARCDDPAQNPAADADLWYRRVKVPQERWDDWVPEGPGYLSMDADDFKKKIRDIDTAGRAGSPTEAPIVTSAGYRARLDGRQLVDGKALLDIAYDGSQTTRMALAPCGLAIGQATWADKDGEPAKMGLGGRKRLEVLVSQPGQLAFDWSLAGKPGSQGAVDFQLELPPAPAIHLTLDLPDGMTPDLERGIAVAEASAPKGFTRWRIELGGRHRTSLRVVPAEDADNVARLPHLRQKLTYTFSPLGVKLVAGLRLDVVNEPVRRLTFVTDADLRLVKIVQDEQSVSWSEAPTPGDDSTRRVTIEFPEPLQGPKREFRISAVAPLKLDRPWRLPGLRAEGVVWQQTEETVAILKIQRPLLVKKLVAIGGRQSKPLREEQSAQPSADGASAPALKGETTEVQYFSLESGVEVVISRPEPLLQLDCGYAIELGGSEVTARVAADFRLDRGERFSLEADVTGQWIIDSVQSDPADALADWKVGSKNGSPRRLTLRLAKAVAPDRPVRIVVTGRRLRWRAGRGHAVKDLVPLSFDASEGGRRLIWLRAVEPYQLALQGVDWVDPQSLDAASSALFAELPGELLFENDPGAANLAVNLETRKPDYSGRIRTDVSVSDTSIIELYRLQCEPNLGRIDRVVVRFSEPMTGDLHWDHGPQDEVRPIGEPQQPDGQTDAVSREGRIWEIRLKPPRSGLFAITVTRTAQLTERRPIGMASLPEASSQEGRVIVYCSGSAAVRIENNGLRQIPCEPAPIGEYGAARATFSYDPARDASGETAALCIAPHSTVVRPPSAWVWSCRLQSRFQADGLGRHLATYRLQSAGKEQLRITLPAGVEPEAVDGAWIDGTRVFCREIGGREARRLAIDLPAKRKFPVVAIHFTTTGPRLNHIHGIKAPLPSVDAPTFSRQWTICLPPGYEAMLDDRQAPASRPGPLSWQRRLFGPLGRPANQGPPDPFKPQDWARLLRRHPTREWAAARTVKLLDNISQQLHSMEHDPKTDPLDWGTLLANASSQALSGGISDDDPELVLLIDQEALANVEVTPRTAVVAPPAVPSAASGIAILNRANLLLLVHEKAILLTGADRAGINGGQIEPFEDQMPWWLRPGRLADRIEAALVQVPEQQFIPVAQWADQPALAGSPWKTRHAAARQPVDTLGWMSYRLEVTDEAPAQVLVIRSNTLRSTRWIAFLALVSLACWKLLYRPAVVIAMAGVFALGAFLLPQLAAPIASGGLIAMLCVLGFRLTCSDFVDRDSAEESAEESESGSWSTAVIKTVLLILVAGAVLAISSSAWGQQQGAGPAALGQVHEVYVQVDKDGEPVGDKYWLSRVFYGELSRRAEALAASPQDWLLGAATYRATLSVESTAKRLVLSDLTAVFDLTLLGSRARVRIEPLVAAGTRLSLDGAMLDGEPIRQIWPEEQKGGGWVFDVEGEDRHSLKLTFGTPDPLPPDAPSGFELTIPPLANSRLELKLPPDAPEIEIPRAVGSVTRREDSSLLVAELGATDRLTVRWHDATRVTVDELLWLKIGPSSVILDAQFKFRVGQGQLKNVSLTVDPRLVRQDPYESDSVEIVEGDRISGRSPPEPHIVPLEFDRPVSDEVTVKANLKLIDILGGGNLVLPRLETRGAVVGKRWLAVSMAPELNRPEQDSEDIESVSVSVSEFMEAWGEAHVQNPDSSYDLSSGRPFWSTVTKLREPITTSTETLEVTFSQEEARLAFEATLDTEGGDRYQYVLSTPPGLAISRISVIQDDQERAARWATAPDDKTTVFLNSAVTGPHKMTLEAQLRAVNRPQIPLPVIQVEGVERLSSRIQLLRQPQVQVHVGGLSGLEEVEIGSMDEAPNDPERLVQCFQVTGEEPVAAQIALAPNIPTLSADQVTTLTHDGNSWNAKIDYRLVIGGGVVDELRLSIPPELNGPFELDPAMAFEPPAEGDRQLIIRPRTPIEGNYRFSILAPLEFAPGERVSVPEVVLEDTKLRKHRLVLPTQFQTRPVQWETRDLRKTKLDDDLLPPLVAPESLVAYRVTGPSFSAAIRPLGGNAEVYLADVSIAWHHGGDRHGVATFDLESANMLECPLNVPRGHRLVQVTVAGTQVMPTPVAVNRWLLPLGPNSLPQRIEVVFDGSGPEPDAEGLVNFDAPTLGNLPVRQTLWTISGPSGLMLQDQDLPTVTPVTPLKHDLVRLQNLTQLGEIAKNSLAEQSPDSGGWQQAFTRRRAAAFRDAKRRLASAGRTHEASQAAELLTAAEIDHPLSDRSIGDGVTQVWLETQSRPHWSTQHFLSQTSGSITLASSGTENGTFSRHLALSAWLAGITFLAMIGVWRGTWNSLFRQWPHLCGVAFGLAWWVWLQPEILGLLVVLLSLASCFSSGWRKSGQSASAIVSLTLNDP